MNPKIQPLASKGDYRGLFKESLMGPAGTSQAFDRLFAKIRPNTYAEGNILFYQGNEPLCLYFLCQGRVKLVRAETSGRQRIVRVISAHDIMGDRALIAGQPYAATAEVMEDARIFVIEAARFWEYWRSTPEAARLFARRLALRLGQADEVASDLAVRTGRERLAKHLAALQDAHGRAGATIVLSESRQELAFLLGMTPEGLSRELAQLVKKRILAIKEREVRVLAPARLRAAARLGGEPLDFHQAPACAASSRPGSVR